MEDNKTTKTLVLLHGAWHGGWCWKKVKPLLENEGYQVFTPTLTGLGERAHLLNREVDLNTHIQDILSLLEYEDLNDVILVGHSYAGMVVSGVAEKAAARLSMLIYLDAFLPESDTSIVDYFKVPQLEEVVQKKGDGWLIPFLGKVEDLGITETDDIEWTGARLGPQPYSTFTQKLKVSSYHQIKGVFIQLSNFPWFTEAAGRARERGFHYSAMLEGGHNAMISKPKEVAELLKGYLNTDAASSAW